MEKRNPEATTLPLCPKAKLQVPALRSSRDDKVEGGGPPWQEWRWMDRAQQQPTGFRLPAFSSTHSASCAVQESVCPLIWTALALSRPYGTRFGEGSSSHTRSLAPEVRFHKK